MAERRKFDAELSMEFQRHARRLFAGSYLLMNTSMVPHDAASASPHIVGPTGTKQFYDDFLNRTNKKSFVQMDRDLCLGEVNDTSWVVVLTTVHPLFCKW